MASRNHSRLSFSRFYSNRRPNSDGEYGSRQHSQRSQQSQQSSVYSQQQQQLPPPSADDYYEFEQRTKRNIVDAETRLYTQGGRNLEPVKSERNPFARVSPQTTNANEPRRGSSPAHLEYQRSKNLISQRRNNLGAIGSGTSSTSASREVSRIAPTVEQQQPQQQPQRQQLQQGQQGRYSLSSVRSDQEYPELSQQIPQDNGAFDAPLPPPVAPRQPSEAPPPPPVKRGNAQAHSRGRVSSGTSAAMSSVQRKFIWEPWTENRTMPEEFANMTEEEYMEYTRSRPEYNASPSQQQQQYQQQQQLQPQETSLDAFQQAFAITRPESPMRGETPHQQQQQHHEHQEPSRVPTSASELWRAAAEQEYQEELEFQRTGQTTAQRQAVAASNRGDVLSRFSAWRTQTTQLPASPNPTQQIEEQEVASKDPAVPPEGVSLLSYERQAIARQADERRRRDAEEQRQAEQQMQKRSPPASNRGGQQAMASPEASGGEFLSKFGAWRAKTEEFQKQQQNAASPEPQSLEDDDAANTEYQQQQPQQQQQQLPKWAKRNSDSAASGVGGGHASPEPPSMKKPAYAKQAPVSDSGLSTRPGKTAAGGDFMSKFSAWRTQGAASATKSPSGGKSPQVLSNPQQNDDGVPEAPQETRAPMFSIALPGMLASKIVRENRRAFESGKLEVLDDSDDTAKRNGREDHSRKSSKSFSPRPPSGPKPPRVAPPATQSSAGQQYEYLVPDRTEPEDDDRDENYNDHNFAQVPTGLIPDDRNEYGMELERSASPGGMSYAPGSDWRYEDPASDGDFLSVYRFSDPRLGRSWTLDSFPRLSEAAFSIVSSRKRVELEGRDRERMLEKQREQEREYERQQRAEEARLRKLLETAKKEDEVLRREREQREQLERDEREREQYESKHDEKDYVEEEPQQQPQMTMMGATKTMGSSRSRVLTRQATNISEVNEQTPIVELGARSAEDLLRGLLGEIERAGLTNIAGLQEEINAVRSFLDTMAATTSVPARS